MTIVPSLASPTPWVARRARRTARAALMAASVQSMRDSNILDSVDVQVTPNDSSNTKNLDPLNVADGPTRELRPQQRIGIARDAPSGFVNTEKRPEAVGRMDFEDCCRSLSIHARFADRSAHCSVAAHAGLPSMAARVNPNAGCRSSRQFPVAPPQPSGCQLWRDPDCGLAERRSRRRCTGGSRTSRSQMLGPSPG